MRNTIAISLLFVGLAIILGGSDAQKPPPKCGTPATKPCKGQCTKATKTFAAYNKCKKDKKCKKNKNKLKKLLGDFNKAAKALKVCMDKPKPTPPKPTRPPTTPRPPPPTTPPPSEKCIELAEAVKNSTEDLEACKATGVDDCTAELEKVKMDYKACMDEKCKDCGKDPNEAVDPACLKKVMEAIQDPIADAMMKVTAAAFEAHEKAAECAPPPPPATTPPPPPATTPPAK